MSKMCTRASLIAVLLSVAMTLPAAAQQQPGPVVWLLLQTSKAGMTNQYEQGRKRHMEWHKKQNDSWRWDVWSIATGPNGGKYLVASFGHHWKDFDGREQFQTADEADVAVNIDSYTDSTIVAFYVFLPEISKPSGTPDPATMVELVHFQIRPGRDVDFNHAIKRTHEAIQKTNWPINYGWYSLANGGEPEYVLALPKSKWADMEPPELSFPAMLEKAFGRGEADMVVKLFDQSVERTWSELAGYRADLSYKPAAR